MLNETAFPFFESYDLLLQLQKHTYEQSHNSFLVTSQTDLPSSYAGTGCRNVALLTQENELKERISKGQKKKSAAITVSCGLSGNTNRPPSLQDLHVIGLSLLSLLDAIALTSFPVSRVRDMLFCSRV